MYDITIVLDNAFLFQPKHSEYYSLYLGSETRRKKNKKTNNKIPW